MKGNDPSYTEKVANFAIQNLDKINEELNITPDKPMVKVLDKAAYGIRQSRHIARNAMVSALLVFLLFSAYIFSADYLRKIKH
jgi:hypothetical protein